MIKRLATLTIASAMSLAFVAMAQAQVVVPPGQDFEATPVSKTDLSTPVAKIAAPAPAPAPAPKKHGGKHKKK